MSLKKQKPGKHRIQNVDTPLFYITAKLSFFAHHALSSLLVRFSKNKSQVSVVGSEKIYIHFSTNLKLFTLTAVIFMIQRPSLSQSYFS